jgi:CDGSH-type Zn-finger protein
MKESEVVLTQYSPLIAVDTKLVGSDEKTVETPRVYSLCCCGESNAKPMCDGSHEKNGFQG